MNRIRIALFILFIFHATCLPAQPDAKHRILILTDIENEPDDAESLVRFLLYSNQFDVEGLVATTSCWQRDKIADWRIHEIVDAYGKVRENLLQHENGYPAYTHLKSIIKKGYPDFGMSAVGEGKDSEGSEWIIKTVDQEDPRPLWVPIWGGANCLAQALWKVKNTRSPEELAQFISKLRVYTISDQDDSGPWMRNTFKDLFYIVSPGYAENGATGYHHATWIGISGERHYHIPTGADTYIVDNDWVDKNIQHNHGPLGEQYPDIAYIMEGDTPSFLYLINNGLGSPEHPDYGSWGGRYELYRPHTENFFHEPEQRDIWTNANDWVHVDGINYIDSYATIWRWREHYQNDFEARMDWCIASYEEANHPPIARLTHNNALEVKAGETVILDASPSTDPDEDPLQFEWFHYREAGTYHALMNPANSKNSAIRITTPEVDKPETVHFIVMVTDNGIPVLTRYQRVIINIYPNK
jgi:hypothetical protein